MVFTYLIYSYSWKLDLTPSRLNPYNFTKDIHLQIMLNPFTKEFPLSIMLTPPILKKWVFGPLLSPLVSLLLYSLLLYRAGQQMSFLSPPLWPEINVSAREGSES